MVEPAKKDASIHDKAKAELMANDDDSSDNNNEEEVFQDCLDEVQFAEQFDGDQKAEATTEAKPQHPVAQEAVAAEKDYTVADGDDSSDASDTTTPKQVPDQTTEETKLEDPQQSNKNQDGNEEEEEPFVE